MAEHGEGVIDATLAADAAHVIHSWSVQGEAERLVMTGGEGAFFRDARGREYLDFASQVVNANLGHQHPAIVSAIADQAARLSAAAPSMAVDVRSELARLLAELTPGDLSLSFFTSGGAEATENALKLARWYTGRQKIVARYRSYHGATAGAAAVSGDPRRWPAEPAVPGVARLFDPYPYRCAAGHPDPCPICSGGPHLEEVLQYEGPENVAAVILETVTGANGVLVPPDGYLQSIREVCSRHGILLILDEVMAGFGRTGRWFACEHWDVAPDIMTVAKGMTSGYLPMGAMVVSEKLRPWLREHTFASGLTATGNPIGCAAAIATIKAMRQERLVENAATMGRVLAGELPRLAARHPSVGEVRGLGLLWGIELVRDRTTREPLVPFHATREEAASVTRLRAAALERGLYLMTRGNLVLVAPPLVIDETGLRTGLGVLDEVLLIADEVAAG